MRTIVFPSGILVPGGFGSRGTEGKIRAAEWARKTSKPYLGIMFVLFGIFMLLNSVQNKLN